MLRPGPRNLITDIAALKVGNAEDQSLKSGVTVLTADAPFTASCHVMGGAPGSRDTDLLAPDKSVAQVDALVLSGGSAFGLEACSGVMEALHAAGRGFQVGSARVPIAPGAILFDLLNGGNKDWDQNPYNALGRAAFANAAQEFALGSYGAGNGATTATLKGGLGSASFVLESGYTIGALVAANPVGTVTTPGERHFWAAPFEIDGEFGALGLDPTAGFATLPTKLTAAEGANTTLAIVATDAPLTKAQCKRLAVASHDGIARAIVPAHTPMDGDLVFALSTSNPAPVDDALPDLCHAGALCLSRAIARAIFHAQAQTGDLLPSWQAHATSKP